ncbi:response regulator transcription factor [Jiangella muralis]|uniref:response regulator transcription factor n=1 Tax=Jiangella muralis TaxID=702383 RepID=UPI000AD846BD|nr:response regulator transcription factor [Jiangella muralis]
MRDEANDDDATIRVLLAEDEELIRVALAGLLAREPDIDVVAAAADGRAALDLALRHRPDVAVLDLQMPGLDGLEVVAELGRALPECAAVILTGHGRPLVLRQALASGARGFLAKGAPGTALADVVRRVHEGHRYVDPILGAEALTAPPSPLTNREAVVLRCANADRPIRDVARELFLSPGTVRNQLSRVTQKLGVATRAEAFELARDSGWI